MSSSSGINNLYPEGLKDLYVIVDQLSLNLEVFQKEIVRRFIVDKYLLF